MPRKPPARGGARRTPSTPFPDYVASAPAADPAAEGVAPSPGVGSGTEAPEIADATASAPVGVAEPVGTTEPVAAEAPAVEQEAAPDGVADAPVAPVEPRRLGRRARSERNEDRTATPERATDTVPGIVLNVEAVAWAVVLTAAAGLRLVSLGNVPLGPAEGLRARGAYDLSRGLTAPEFGGDLTSGLTSLVLRLFGDSALTVRIVPALLGVAAVAALALYRPLIGRGAALVAALLLALSPVAVVTARTLNPEAAALPLALLLPPLVQSVLFQGRIGRLPWLTALIGLGLGSGAVFIVVLVVTLIWLAVESAWLDAPEPGATLAALRSDRGRLVEGAFALLPGLILAVARYGGGTDRVTLAGLRAWAGSERTAALIERWHYVPDVLFAYEPLAFALGLSGGWVLLRAWRGGFATRGERLLLLWLGAGAAITLFWLHREPGHLLALTVPLALLGGIATARIAGGLATIGARRWEPLLLLLLVPALGYVLAQVFSWTSTSVIQTQDKIGVAVALAGCVLAVGWVLSNLPRAAGGLLLLLGWLLLAPVTLHATTALALHNGSEILTGTRTLAEVEGVQRWIENNTPPGETVWVERRVWPSLAWPLRERPVQVFVQTAPAGVAAVEATGGILAPGAPVAADRVPVVERWSPSGWDGLGILRWWAYRRAWGPVEGYQAVVGRR